MAQRQFLIYTPNTSLEFAQCLIEARPGDVIQLLPKDYHGQFILAALPTHLQPLAVAPHGQNGQNNQNQLPITVQGSKSADFQRFTTIVSRRTPHKGIQITGGNWILSSLIIKSKYGQRWDFQQVGIEVVSSGHLLRDIILNQSRTGLRIIGNDNRIENLKVNNSNIAIEILGNGNSIKDAVLSRIKNDGIILSPTTTGTVIERTIITMKRNVARRNERRGARQQRGWRANEGRSLRIMDGVVGTRVKASTFTGIANLGGHGDQYEGCKFLGVNLAGVGNDFRETEVTKLYRDPVGWDNVVRECCEITGQVAAEVKFDEL